MSIIDSKQVNLLFKNAVSYSSSLARLIDFSWIPVALHTTIRIGGISIVSCAGTIWITSLARSRISTANDGFQILDDVSLKLAKLTLSQLFHKKGITEGIKPRVVR